MTEVEDNTNGVGTNRIANDLRFSRLSFIPTNKLHASIEIQLELTKKVQLMQLKTQNYDKSSYILFIYSNIK